MTANDSAEQTISEIVWPDPLLRDAAAWSKNVEVVKMLCRIGQVTEWLNGRQGKDEYVHMPYRYDVEGTQVEFLPHWGFISVGMVDLDILTKSEDVIAAANAVTTLVGLGMRVKTKR